MNNALQNYQKVMLDTAPPINNIILLYQKALYWVQVACNALSEKKYGIKGEAILKTIDIINVLDSGLDFDKGEIADNLHASYQEMLAQLTRGNIDNDETCLRAVENWLTELLAAWQQAQKTNG